MVQPTRPRFQSHGLRPWTVRPHYETYRSPFAPQYRVPFNIHGINLKQLARYALHFSGFGVVAGIALLYFTEGVPRVRRDILQKFPVIGEYWDREIPPSDNPY